LAAAAAAAVVVFRLALTAEREKIVLSDTRSVYVHCTASCFPLSLFICLQKKNINYV
jgi:hypothetical protein